MKVKLSNPNLIMIRIFSVRNPAIASVENKLHKLRIGLILTMWALLLVSILVGRLNLRNLFALALNVLCFACLNIMCEVAR